MRIVSRDEIEAALDQRDAIASIAEGFRLFSQGKVELSAVGYLRFADAKGDCHVKGGYIQGDPLFVVKVATGFYQNPALGLPTSNGFVAVLSADSGEPLGLLLDEGRLTDLRTAMAGAIAARRIVPSGSTKLGIVGTGIQAELQGRFIAQACGLRVTRVWGRHVEHAAALAARLQGDGVQAAAVEDVSELCAECDVIVTTTPSTEPLIMADMVKPGTRIVAVGADAPGKCELEPCLFGKTQVVVADSREQCLDHGEIQHAFAQGFLDPAKLVELGTLLETEERVGDADSIVIADLTGLGVQDVQIAKSVWSRLAGLSG